MSAVCMIHWLENTAHGKQRVALQKHLELHAGRQASLSVPRTSTVAEERATVRSTDTR